MLDKLRRKLLFTKIFKSNFWKGESRSGTGSDISQTLHLIAELPTLLKSFEIGELLDIPCGDFNWMSRVNLGPIKYTGGDIVGKLIRENQEKFAQSGRKFQVLDIVVDPLPSADAIFSRDFLVHMPYREIGLVLKNIRKSQIKYLITTTFTARQKNNDIQIGDWRPINLELPPFNFSKPLAVLNEKCTEAEMQFSDKSLAVWRTSDIPDLAL